MSAVFRKYITPTITYFISFFEKKEIIASIGLGILASLSTYWKTHCISFCFQTFAANNLFALSSYLILNIFHKIFFSKKSKHFIKKIFHIKTDKNEYLKVKNINLLGIFILGLFKHKEFNNIKKVFHKSIISSLYVTAITIFLEYFVQNYQFIKKNIKIISSKIFKNKWLVAKKEKTTYKNFDYEKVLQNYYNQLDKGDKEKMEQFILIQPSISYLLLCMIDEIKDPGKDKPPFIKQAEQNLEKNEIKIEDIKSKYVKLSEANKNIVLKQILSYTKKVKEDKKSKGKEKISESEIDEKEEDKNIKIILSEINAISYQLSIAKSPFLVIYNEIIKKLETKK